MSDYYYMCMSKSTFDSIDFPQTYKTFLEDVRRGEFCKGLIAVTHSPFIFDNTLDTYAHGIEEFRY